MFRHIQAYLDIFRLIQAYLDILRHNQAYPVFIRAHSETFATLDILKPRIVTTLEYSEPEVYSEPWHIQN